MKIDLEASDLRPLVEVAVAEAMKQLQGEQERLNGRLAYPESEAAALLGVARHVLRDARLRGELTGSRCGKRVVYTRAELLAYLEKTRLN